MNGVKWLQQTQSYFSTFIFLLQAKWKLFLLKIVFDEYKIMLKMCAII